MPLSIDGRAFAAGQAFLLSAKSLLDTRRSIPPCVPSIGRGESI